MDGQKERLKGEWWKEGRNEYGLSGRMCGRKELWKEDGQINNNNNNNNIIIIIKLYFTLVLKTINISYNV